MDALFSRDSGILQERLPCPLCLSSKHETLLNLDCGNMDRSSLYPTVRLKVCSSCGHAFNTVLPGEISGLDSYYDFEYATVNLSSLNTQGDLPGSNGIFTRNRYRSLYDFLQPYIDPQDKILDVGCALGGFLNFLKRRGFQHLCGVDMSVNYVERARATGSSFRVEIGSAQSLPFGDRTFDVVVMEQVMEHLIDPEVAVREADRVLKENGLLCVGVPDASRYRNFPFFDFYWLLLREHVQHFDREHLTHLAARAGFKSICHGQDTYAIMGESMVMPSLKVLFRKSNHIIGADRGNPRDMRLRQQLLEYVVEESAIRETRILQFDELTKSRLPVYAWGIGREFLYLYESTGLKHCNIAGLIDLNPHKQMHGTVGGIRISSPRLLGKSEPNSVLAITAIAHSKSISRSLGELYFPGKILSVNNRHSTRQDVPKYGG